MSPDFIDDPIILTGGALAYSLPISAIAGFLIWRRRIRSTKKQPSALRWAALFALLWVVTTLVTYGLKLLMAGTQYRDGVFMLVGALTGYGLVKLALSRIK